ncbi:MAG TPA: gliding motility-associated C-terminal domain-containing protein, partial [Chitinophagaceae bacterium]
KVDSVRWDLGDPASGADNYSTAFQVDHEYPGPGTYKVRALVYNKCIADTSTTFITITPDLSVQVPDQIKDTMICLGDVLQLNARNGSSNAYTWENGLILPDRTITEAGSYRVMIMNDCSIAVKEFKVSYDNCPCSVFVPNAFSPNNDGLNDVFKPATQCYTRDYRFEIYNRFGSKVFSSTDPSRGWDGSTGPYPQSTGTFVWTLQYRDPNTRKMLFQKGTVVLLR